jgi:hypothetical protein
MAGKAEPQKHVEWVDADPDVVYAFERGIMFGFKAAQKWDGKKARHGAGGPSSDLWTIDEWRAELQSVVDWMKEIKAAHAKAGK